MSAGLEALDQLDHLADVLGCGTDHIRTDQVQGVVVLEESVRVELGDVPDSLSGLSGALFHLVLAVVAVTCEMTDVGDVHDMLHLVAGMSEDPLEGVLENIGPEVSDMRVVVDRRSAAVHSHILVRNGFELLNCTRHRVIQIYLHMTLRIMNQE